MKKRGCSFFMEQYKKEFKIKVLEHFKKYGVEDTLRVYNVSKRAVYYWKRKHESGGLMRKKSESYIVD